MRLIFAGTPDFAVPSLNALIGQGHSICAVYTQPDRPAKRGQQLQASPVKQCALAHGLPVYQPVSLRHEAANLEALQADAMIVVAYGLLLPESVLSIPRWGCINVHGSLLPRWRGAAPIQRALAAGDEETGVTIMAMDKGLDTGGMYWQKPLTIEASDTSATLFAKLAELGAEALLEALPGIAAGTLTAVAQDSSLACHAAKLSKQEAILDWHLPATTLARQVRAFNPWPVASFQRDQHGFKIWQAVAIDNPRPTCAPGSWLSLNEHGLAIACQQGALLIRQLQFPNQKSQAVADIYRQGLLADLFQLYRA